MHALKHSVLPSLQTCTVTKKDPTMFINPTFSRIITNKCSNEKVVWNFSNGEGYMMTDVGIYCPVSGTGKTVYSGMRVFCEGNSEPIRARLHLYAPVANGLEVNIVDKHGLDGFTCGPLSYEVSDAGKPLITLQFNPPEHLLKMDHNDWPKPPGVPQTRRSGKLRGNKNIAHALVAADSRPNRSGYKNQRAEPKPKPLTSSALRRLMPAQKATRGALRPYEVQARGPVAADHLPEPDTLWRRRVDGASPSHSSSLSSGSSEDEVEGEASAAAAKRPGCCNKEHECCVAVYTIDKPKDDATRKVRGVMRN